VAPGGAAPRVPSREELEADPSYGARMRAYASIFPAWDTGVREFYEQSDEIAVAANTTQFELLGYTPPRDAVGYVRGFAQDGLCAAFQEVTWQIAIGGRILQTFKPIAQVGSFIDPATMAWPYTGGQRVSVLVTTGAQGYTLAAMFHIIEKNLDLAAPERF